MAPYQHTYESAPTNQKKKDRLGAFLANYGETWRVLKALLALAKRQPDAASSPSSTRYSQPRLARTSHWPALRHAPRQPGLHPRALATEAMFGGHFTQPMVADALSWSFPN